MKTQTKEEVYRAMKADVEELLKLTPDSGRRWTHTRTDLIEMIYIVFLTADLSRDDGSPATFRWMVTRIFNNLGLHVPANPVAVAMTARNRKGVRQRPFEERYFQSNKGLRACSPEHLRSARTK